MPRIFASLAIATLTLFALTTAIAFFDDPSVPDRHIFLGLGTLLLSCFIQVVGFTYLTVTGKVIAQATHFANLDTDCLSKVKQYKRSFTHQLALAVASVVLASASGGVSWRSREGLALHFPAAMLAAVIHVWVYRRQYHVLRRNTDLMETTLKAYSLWRTRRISRNVPLLASAESNALAP